MKNRIINGAMVIDQRNAGASVALSNVTTYMVDRFAARATTGSGNTGQQSTTAPTGFVNSLKITCGTAGTVAATDNNWIYQSIEGYNVADLGWGTANAKTVTLSFQVYSSLTGTFGGVLRNSAGDRSYPFTYTISSANTWTVISVTVAGDTSGTWGTTNGDGIVVFFGLGSGSNFLGTAGSWASANYRGAIGEKQIFATSGATFYITGVQLEVGTSATGFEYVNYQTSLANCQRYYETGQFYASGYSNATNDPTFGLKFAVAKRTAPTATITAFTTVFSQFLAGGTVAATASATATDSMTITDVGTTSTGIVRICQTWTASAEL
jgi:hypothetical protein